MLVVFLCSSISRGRGRENDTTNSSEAGREVDEDRSPGMNCEGGGEVKMGKNIYIYLSLSLEQLLFTEDGLSQLWRELNNDDELQSTLRSVAMGTGDRDSTLESGAGGEGDEGNVDTNVRAEERERGGGGGGDGEEGGGPVRGGKKSQFFNILAELTWGQVTDSCKATLPQSLVFFILCLLQ